MKRILIVALSAMLAVLMVMPAMASDQNYTIEDVTWRTNNGSVEATWDKAASSTSYKVNVYKMVGGSKKSVYKETTGACKLYVSPIIAFYGSGTYYFDVYPTKGGEQYKKSSDAMEVDETYLKTIKAQVGSDIDAAQNAPVQPTYVWNQGPGGVWQLRKDGNLVTNQWVQLGGYWYLLDTNGCMCKGWHEKDGKFYYLNEVSGTGGYPEGACWMNGVTPDGHKVDNSGARIS